MEKIYYTKPSITELEREYVNDAMLHGWGERCYEYIDRFEKDFAAHLGVKFAISSSSCTGALTLGLAALGIGPGDEVVVADTNWIASVAPISHLGAVPIFVDIRPDTWCIDPDQVRAAITPNTKAILAVHLYGNLCAMDELLRIGAEYNIPVIEDAAEGIGSVFQGKRAGSMGSFGVFSFHGTKTLTTGEGGMFVTNDRELYETALTLSNHGRARGSVKQFWPDRLGYKFKLSNIQAALGCAQLLRIEDLIQTKRKILQNYRDLLSECDAITLNIELPNTQIGAWMPSAVFGRETNVTREKLISAFKQEGIDARVFFYPLSTTSIYGSKFGQANAVDIAARAVNLPSFHDMTMAQQEIVVAVLKNMLRAA